MHEKYNMPVESRKIVSVAFCWSTSVLSHVFDLNARKGQFSRKFGQVLVPVRSSISWFRDLYLDLVGSSRVRARRIGISQVFTFAQVLGSSRDFFFRSSKTLKKFLKTKRDFSLRCWRILGSFRIFSCWYILGRVTCTLSCVGTRLTSFVLYLLGERNLSSFWMYSHTFIHPELRRGRPLSPFLPPFLEWMYTYTCIHPLLGFPPFSPSPTRDKLGKMCILGKLLVRCAWLENLERLES